VCVCVCVHMCHLLGCMSLYRKGCILSSPLVPLHCGDSAYVVYNIYRNEIVSLID
jgi:hypothetical protein